MANDSVYEQTGVKMDVHPNVAAFDRLCRKVMNGTIEVKVQDGLPVRAFRTTENIDLVAEGKKIRK